MKLVVRKFLLSKWLPWVIVASTLLVVILHELFQPDWMRNLSRLGQAAIWAGLLVIFVLILLAGYQIIQINDQRAQLSSRLEETQNEVKQAYQRVETIFRASQGFVQANDEREVIDQTLKLSVELVGAVGASFVPLDEHGQSLPTVSYGDMPIPSLTDWVEYLASPVVRERCRACKDQDFNMDRSGCPLLTGTFSDSVNVYCLPLQRGDRGYGILNIFMPITKNVDIQASGFLRALVDETSLALESVILRKRELEALRQTQSLRQKTDLDSLLKELLINIHKALEADFAVLSVKESRNRPTESMIVEGVVPLKARPFIDAILQGAMASGEPVLLGEVEGTQTDNTGVKSLLAAPLISPEREPLGALLLGSHRLKGFTQRQLVLLQTISDQVALVIQNSNIMAEIEYKTLIQERTRLAREIHDGLAQTLGFLKLQVAQMKNYLARGDMEHLQQNVEISYATLSDAYQDVRQAIDGLRMNPGDMKLDSWLEQVLGEFQDVSGLKVEFQDGDIRAELPPEVHAQLIRIVQEALNNVRKHSHAEHVRVQCRGDGKDLWLEISDDGIGFSSDDVPGPSQHGLRGMRERAELIGADFQLVSKSKEGTTVRLRLPLMGMQLGEVSL